MSDLDAVAGAMGVPAELVRRSADARATANGTSADEVLSAWGGGGTVAAPPPPEPASETGEKTSAESAPEPEPAVTTPPEAPVDPGVAATAPAAVAAPPSTEPPTLVGARDNPWAVVVGAVGLFIAVVLLGLVGPAVPTGDPGARTGDIVFSESAGEGQALYTSLGCASCHTQMIRPVVADVGLGPVTLNDTDEVLGTRRFGPDLAEIGVRMSDLQLEGVIERSNTHPTYHLSDEDLSNLVTYLLESTTAGAER